MDESITVGEETVANVLLLVELSAVGGLVVGVSDTSKYTGIIGTEEEKKTLGLLMKLNISAITGQESENFEKRFS